MARSRRILTVVFAALAFALGAVGMARSLTNFIEEGYAHAIAEQVVPSLAISGAIFFALTLLYLQQKARDVRRSQQRLDDETKKLNTAISHMAHGLLMFDASHRLVLSNSQYLDLYGLLAEIVKPRISLRELLVHRKEVGSFSGDIDEYCEKLTSSVRDGHVFSVVGDTSEGRLVRIVNTPLEGGGWVSTHEDITHNQRLIDALKEAEATTRQKEVQLDAALNHIVQGLCMFDAEGRVLLFNRRYCELMGDDDSDVAGISLVGLLKRRKAQGTFVGDPDQVVRELVARIQAGEISVNETRGRDGCILRVVRHPIKGGGWVATFEDVTEQHRAEEERDRSRAFLDLIIENVPSVIYVKKATDRTFVLVNREWERFWGLSRQAVIGKNVRAVFREKEAAIIEARDDQLLASASPIFEEREVVTYRAGRRSVFGRRLVLRDASHGTEYILGVVDDITERKAAEARISYLAHYDALTGLPNRTFFREQLEKELLLVKRGAKLAVLYLDLDQFKTVNDTLGHSAGDELLKEVSQRLRKCIRDSDLIARLGGDEFAIVQTGMRDPKDAEALALHLQDSVLKPPFDLNGHLTSIDLSIGISLAPNDAMDTDELLKNADLALYRAKIEGRSGYRYFEPEMNERMKRRRMLESELRSAIVNDEFLLYYQPIVSLKTGKITGCEALLRWANPHRGMIAPSEFIPVAEDTGLIGKIGEWVLRQACTDAANWPSEVKVAVNVSAMQFRNGTLPLMVAAALADSGLHAQRLELEITESVLMQNNDPTLAALRQIHELGVGIALDDFGTGHSSLSYLRRFPFNKIKIDRSFVADLTTNDEAAAIVRSIVELAHTLKMTTTAEGVETASQRKILKAAGCDEMQGYLFSRAQPASKLAERLKSLRLPARVA
jgi:diguanylate cyclase (GGDEF)-like protein/PAS domain S-box-containing protein